VGPGGESNRFIPTSVRRPKLSGPEKTSSSSPRPHPARRCVTICRCSIASWPNRKRGRYTSSPQGAVADQVNELHDLITDLDVNIGTYTFDGDTPQERPPRHPLRRAYRGHNPDMLHAGILPHHTKWIKLFENLNTSLSTRCISIAAFSGRIWPT